MTAYVSKGGQLKVRGLPEEGYILFPEAQVGLDQHIKLK